MLMEFAKITFTYPSARQTTLENFSLQIVEGKKLALIGHNGCGKTTLFLLANGLYRPTAGNIYWQGAVLKYDRGALNQWRQNVGLVFQNPEQQLVATTVEEDLSYGLCNFGLPTEEIKIRIRQTLTDFNLTDLADYPVNYLSLGQKKRLAIADVMILKPKMLLLDEPTAFLDPQQKRELQQNLTTISQEGTTMLLATHDLDFVYNWADWIYVMDTGKLILEGTPTEVFKEKELLKKLRLGTPIALDLMTKLQSMNYCFQDLNEDELRTIFQSWQQND